MTPEELYLGQLMLHPEHLYRYPLRPGDFRNARNRAVFLAISGMIDRSEPVDLPAVALALPDIDRVWLAALTSEPTNNLQRLCDTIIQDTRRHKLNVLVRETLERVQADPVGSLVERLEQGLAEITEGRGDEIKHLRDLVLPAAAEFERRIKAHGVLPGIGSGVSTLDQVTMGFEPRKLYLIGARPSEGKSALLLHIAIEAAKQKQPVGMISIESSAFEIVARAFSAVGGIPGTKLRTGMLGGTDQRRIFEAGEILHGLPIVIADRPNMPIDEVKSRARQMVRQHGCKLVTVDYVQLVQAHGVGNDYERVSAVSVALKQLARELEIPIVAAAQLSRGDKQARGKKPTLSDFKNSGQLEQDADVAILIYRKQPKDGEEQTWLCVEKNRDGLTGDVQVYFDKARMRFSPISHD